MFKVYLKMKSLNLKRVKNELLLVVLLVGYIFHLNLLHVQD